MSWDKVTAVSYLRWHAAATSQRRCARYVREAIERGGIKLIRTHSARNYGDSLRWVGFYEASGSPQRGDVVIQAIAGHDDGHMAMYDGEIWISDFKQYYGFYPGPEYRNVKPPYKMYRHDRGMPCGQIRHSCLPL